METAQQSEIGQLEEILNNALLEGSQTTLHFAQIGRAYHVRYNSDHQQEDFENTVQYYETALEVDSVDKDYHGQLLSNLGSLLLTRYEQLGAMKDLEEAITYAGKALNFCPPGHEDRSGPLNNLALMLDTRFKKLGEMKDLEMSIACYEETLSLCPHGHPNRSTCLNNCGNALTTRYEQIGEMVDLEKAITYHEEALSLHPPAHPKRSMSLTNLGNALSARYGQLGDVKDLEAAITYNEQALILCPPGHPVRPMSLNNLATTLFSYYGQIGEIKDLEKAITCHEQALELYPPGHPDRSMALQNFANAVYTRFTQGGEIKDLEKCIAGCEEALNLFPSNHIHRPLCLTALANALKSRYEHLGELRNLSEAVTCFEQALDLLPPGHPSKPGFLNDLGVVLSNRYEKLGEINDLKKAINYHKQALDLGPPGHPDISKALGNLGGCLRVRYQQFQEQDDLEMAITYHSKALALHRPGQPERSKPLNNLANTFHTRYQQLGKMKDLEKAITYHEEALSLCPLGHPYRPMTLYHVANTLHARYQRLEETTDLEKATAGFKTAFSCLSPQHPYFSLILRAQASLEISAHQSVKIACNNCSHVDEACTLFQLAAYHATSYLHDRLTAAKLWAHIAHEYQNHTAIDAYSLALELQQQRLALLPSIMSQQKLVEDSAQLGLDAASCAISAGKSEMAIQLLEQGRSILWSKIAGYRQPLDELSEKNSQLADEFRIVAHQLANNGVLTDVDISHQHNLSEKWTALLRTIRKLDGFSNFLQAVPFNKLQKAAKEGPIITVNVSKFRSDALILNSSGPPIIVALDDKSPEILQQLLHQLLEITNGIRPSKDVVSLLQQLWSTVVHPVVKRLLQLNVQERSRIWWCPTSYLCGLPIHAAGPYQQGSNNLPYLYTSSYIPTLTSLIRARSDIANPQAIPKMLVISQADTLPKVAEEVDIVKQFSKNISSFSGQDAHKETVLQGLQSHSWVHFACHGHLEGQPFESWFELHNGEPLTILDLAKAQLPNAEFAFLSACHSAAGDIYGTPDESIHLAAALQFCGFRSVVGTLWAMADADGPLLAHAFYSYMYHNGDNVNFRHAAEALNVATKKLKKQGVPLDRRINFIHIGA